MFKPHHNPITQSLLTLYQYYFTQQFTFKLYTYKHSHYIHYYTTKFNQYIPLTTINLFKLTTLQNIQHQPTPPNYHTPPLQFPTKQQLLNFFHNIK